MSKLDCYAVLGLSPNAEGVVIRAAYLALMRSYHPDRNPSAEAAARARAVTEAYETIGDPASRAEYDARRWEPFAFLDAGDDVEPPPPRQWRKAPVIGVAAASALPILLAAMVLPMTQGWRADAPPPAEPLADKALASEESAVAPARTQARPSAPSLAQASPPPPAPAALAEPEKPLPTPAPAGARPKPVKATVARQPERPARAPSLTAAAGAKPTAIDEKARVAALEMQATSFYNQSVNHADGAKRLQLQQARDLFVASRNACRSDKCVGDAHANYIRDIALIVQKRQQTTP